LEREQTTDPTLVANLVVAEWEKSRKPDQAPSVSPAHDIESRQQAAAERWAARQQQPAGPGKMPQRTVHKRCEIVAVEGRTIENYAHETATVLSMLNCTGARSQRPRRPQPNRPS
jgi:hypothetical protein